MRVSIIITTYNRPDALLLVLQSIEGQTKLPKEVVIADDGSDTITQELITDFQKSSNLNIIHSWQKDKGFRVAKSRNKAIVKSSGDYIILLDGDVILHRKFIQDHINNAQANYFVQGSRVLLTEDETNKIFDSKTISFSFFSRGLKNRSDVIISREDRESNPIPCTIGDGQGGKFYSLTVDEQQFGKWQQGSENWVSLTP